VLRVKYRFKTIEGGGLAAGLDLRLPTADETELLVRGHAGQAVPHRLRLREALRPTSTWATPSRAEAHHRPCPTSSTTPRLDAALLAGDLHRRRHRTRCSTTSASTRWRRREFTHGFEGPVQTTITDYELQKADLNMLLGSVGLKINLRPPARERPVPGKRGLQDYFTPIVSVDYTF
jgi:hypothetical protein